MYYINTLVQIESDTFPKRYNITLGMPEKTTKNGKWY